MSVPLVAPFSGERFADLSAMSSLIAPPYDVISPTMRAELAARDNHNIVRLILPESNGDRYGQAASVLQRWRQDGVIVPDGEPAVYVLRQDFIMPDGERHERTGVIVAVAVEPFDEGRVKPHERTHAGPKEDRLALLRATGAMFESLLMVARDGKETLRSALRDVVQGDPTMTASLDGVGIVLWRVSGGAADAIVRAVGEQSLYIADGHHRFETAVAYRGDNASADRVPVLIVPIDDPGLVVLPTHRVVHGTAVDRKAFVNQLRERFQIRELPAAANYLEALDAMQGRGTAAIVVTKEGAALALLLKGGASIGDLSFANEPTVASLDVARIDVLVVDLLAAEAGVESHVTYSHDGGQVIESVAVGSAVAGVLLNPMGIDEVLAVADAGAVMPPKSTYFMPKVPSGLIIMSYTEVTV